MSGFDQRRGRPQVRRDARVPGAERARSTTSCTSRTKGTPAPVPIVHKSAAVSEVIAQLAIEADEDPE